MARDLPDMRVSSAGLAALAGHSADPVAALVAAEIGLDLTDHIARQITEEMCMSHDLILVMESAHRFDLSRQFPQMMGRIMLFDHWIGGQGIRDPYTKPLEVHRATRDRLLASAQAWTFRLCAAAGRRS